MSAQPLLIPFHTTFYTRYDVIHNVHLGLVGIDSIYANAKKLADVVRVMVRSCGGGGLSVTHLLHCLFVVFALARSGQMPSV